MAGSKAAYQYRKNPNESFKSGQNRSEQMQTQKWLVFLVEASSANPGPLLGRRPSKLFVFNDNLNPTCGPERRLWSILSCQSLTLQ
jgi:hypothetical protein